MSSRRGSDWMNAWERRGQGKGHLLNEKGQDKKTVKIDTSAIKNDKKK
jgi:hypothetical protein